MTGFVRLFVFLVLANLCFAPLRANAAVATPRIVKWEAVAGNGNEFVIYMPQGYSTASDGGFVLGKPGENGRVDRQITAYRYINGVVLMMEYYEGDVRSIEKSLQATEKSPGEKRQVNGFEMSQFDSASKGYETRKQYFRFKNRLYVILTISKTASDPIAEGFLKSLHLINGKDIVQPNLPTGAASLILKGITENDSAAADGAGIDADLADRKVIVIHSPRPKFPRGDISGTDGKVKLKILYSAIGKVTDVEVIESPSKAFAKAAVEAVKNTAFIPAEKDGRPVSAYDVLEYSFTSSMSGFIL